LRALPRQKILKDNNPFKTNEGISNKKRTALPSCWNACRWWRVGSECSRFTTWNRYTRRRPPWGPNRDVGAAEGAATGACWKCSHDERVSERASESHRDAGPCRVAG